MDLPIGMMIDIVSESDGDWLLSDGQVLSSVQYLSYLKKKFLDVSGYLYSDFQDGKRGIGKVQHWAKDDGGIIDE